MCRSGTDSCSLLISWTEGELQGVARCACWGRGPRVRPGRGRFSLCGGSRRRGWWAGQRVCELAHSVGGGGAQKGAEVEGPVRAVHYGHGEGRGGRAGPGQGRDADPLGGGVAGEFAALVADAGGPRRGNEAEGRAPPHELHRLARPLPLGLVKNEPPAVVNVDGVEQKPRALPVRAQDVVHMPQHLQPPQREVLHVANGHWHQVQHVALENGLLGERVGRPRNEIPLDVSVVPEVSREHTGRRRVEMALRGENTATYLFWTLHI